MGEHDCVWDASQKITLDPTRDAPPSPQRNLQSEGNHPLSQDSNLRHIHHPRGKSFSSLPPSFLLSFLAFKMLELSVLPLFYTSKYGVASLVFLTP
jgi:hypothetical protein